MGPAARGLDRRRGVRLCRSGSGAGLQPRSPGLCIRTRRSGRRLHRRPAGAGRGAAVAVHVPARLRAGADRRRAGDRSCRRGAAERRAGRLVRRCADRGAGDGRSVNRAAGHAGNERQRRLRAPGRATRRTTPGHPGAQRQAGHRLPRDRRVGPSGPAARDARRERPGHGPLDGRGRLPPGGMGDRPVVPDRGEPGRDPAGVERGHPGLSVGGEGAGGDDGLLFAGRTARRSSGAMPGPGCWRTGARAAGTSSRARQRRRS